MAKLRIEADRASSRAQLITFAVEQGAIDVVPECAGRVFTCRISSDRAAALLVDFRHSFPRAYYQGWVEPSAP